MQHVTTEHNPTQHTRKRRSLDSPASGAGITSLGGRQGRAGQGRAIRAEAMRWRSRSSVDWSSVPVVTGGGVEWSGVECGFGSSVGDGGRGGCDCICWDSEEIGEEIGEHPGDSGGERGGASLSSEGGREGGRLGGTAFGGGGSHGATAVALRKEGRKEGRKEAQGQTHTHTGDRVSGGVWGDCQYPSRLLFTCGAGLGWAGAASERASERAREGGAPTATCWSFGRGGP
ncbi:hypothetical protein KC19_7G188900 [Ceratodon purpureus]|uniref:Uncharacterized protein n=1 Tax=Ceratodon purpureus TaxID=3225 RepID=A0A8T0H9N8_CERPU|nr:hypothetical protein KC19_7G188900 [Ceratodon purpureus]